MTKKLIFVWGDKKLGVAIERKERRSKSRYWWDILHFKGGKAVWKHSDYPSQAEALREARKYAQYERANPKKGFCNMGTTKKHTPKLNRP